MVDFDRSSLVLLQISALKRVRMSAVWMKLQFWPQSSSWHNSHRLHRTQLLHPKHRSGDDLLPIYNIIFFMMSHAWPQNETLSSSFIIFTRIDVSQLGRLSHWQSRAGGTMRLVQLIAVG
jgi:hypothetical protein